MISQYTPSNNEIVKIKKGVIPHKVIDEGDTLQVGTKIHSFYWPMDGIHIDDYEPIAVQESDKCCLTRIHYNGIAVWQKYYEKSDKPVAYFRAEFHTPMICTSQKPFLKKMPSDLLARMILSIYFLPKINQETSHN